MKEYLGIANPLVTQYPESLATIDLDILYKDTKLLNIKRIADVKVIF